MSAQVLFVAPVSFARLKQRHQAFATELAGRGYEVLFLEPLRSPGWSCKVVTAGCGLKTYSISVPFRAASYPGLQTVCARLAFSLFKRRTGIKPSETILWLAEPSFAAIAAHSWRTVVYDRCDLHGAFPGQRRAAWQKYEDSLWRRSDLISISHPFLTTGMPADAASRTVLVPNACSEDFVRACRRVTEVSPENRGLQVSASVRHDAAGLKKVYVSSSSPIRLISSGAHYEWVDCDWLKMLSELEGAELHIAGPGRGESYKRLVGSKNVINHGLLDHAALSDLLWQCHIGLIPFRDLELIKGVDPIKAYEYAACGLEVWSPDLKPLRANPVIGRFVADPGQAEEGLKSFRTAPQLFSGPIPVWGERLQTILDRLVCLRSD